MKVLVIPDIHLKPWMFQRAAKIMEQGLPERRFVLWIFPMTGIRNITSTYTLRLLTRQSRLQKIPETLWSFGNHDLCYIWDERESGYSFPAAEIVPKKIEELERALPKENEIRYVQKN